MDDQQKLLRDFLTRQRFAVVATTYEGRPQCATVAFTADGLELIFGTLNDTRKYRNLTLDPHVAVVIGWDEAVTVQCEGTARVVSAEETQDCQRLHVRKHPSSQAYAELESQRYIKVTPTWIRYTDISQEPEYTFELTLKDGIEVAK